MKRFFILFIIAWFPFAAYARELPEKTRKSIDSLMSAGLKAGYFPGASIAVGNRDGILYEQCYGYRDNTKTAQVTPDDIYDIASVTKVVATTFSVMRLYDEGKIDLNKFVGDYISCYNDTPVAKITITQLLTHTSGLPYFPAYSLLFSNAGGGSYISYGKGSDKYPYPVDKNTYRCTDALADPEYVSDVYIEGYRRAGRNIYINPGVDGLIVNRIIESYNPELRGKYKYTDSNFYILRQVVENISDMNFDDYTKKLFKELGMSSTGFKPLEWKVPELIIPTEYDYLMCRGQIQGYAHDDLAAVHDNVEGNAGLFSNASDLSRFCEMLLNDGEFRGERVISARTVRLFTSSPLRPKGIHRGLGFDKRGSTTSLYDGYGHTGYTGTMIWMDDKHEIFMVFLSNRVHPTRLNNGLSNSNLRGKLWEILKKGY